MSSFVSHLETSGSSMAFEDMRAYTNLPSDACQHMAVKEEFIRTSCNLYMPAGFF